MTYDAASGSSGHKAVPRTRRSRQRVVLGRGRSIFALIGPNGAGKTTLFNMIAGVFRPEEGADFIWRTPTHGLVPEAICAAGVARTFQIVRPFPPSSLCSKTRLLERSCASRCRSRSRSAAEILRLLELWDRRTRKAGSLTLPDRKRLELARALATRPRLLLLDEVMAGLRPTETDRMVAVMREINRARVLRSC